MRSFRHWLASRFGGMHRSFQQLPHLSAVLTEKIDFRQLEQTLGYRIKNQALFIQAVVHRSYLQNSNLSNLESNERLEFLGDAVLNLVVAQFLYSAYPGAEEGALTVIRSRLVNRKALIYYARALNIRDFLLLSMSAAQGAEKGADTIVADAFEALLGAMYLDSGIQPVQKFIVHQVEHALRSGFLDAPDDNYKSALLEFAQAHGMPVPRYSVIKEEGPDHDRTFTVEVFIGKESFGIGIGKNKKEAEQSAAEKAMKHLPREAHERN
ncbi:MAG: ribonuclease III [Bacteroidota bacterium]|nr:ribonuclease III [Bacteroidota bacterium]